MEIDKCSKCDCGGKRPIVNKHFYLCAQKNQERLQAGKPPKKREFKRWQPKPGHSSKKQKPIKKVSTTNRYRCSDGTLVTQGEINHRLREAYNRIDAVREPVCQGTGSTQYPLSHSHTISVARCKELGKAELIWDKNNIELEGYHEPSSFPKAAHNIWETGSLEQKRKLLNFERKLEYIKKHDPETWFKLQADEYIQTNAAT